MSDVFFDDHLGDFSGMGFADVIGIVHIIQRLCFIES